MVRLNITLPVEIAKKLDSKSNKSRFIAEVLKEKFDQENRKKLECLLIEGYKSTSYEDRKLNIDWEKVNLEKWD